MVNGRSRVIVTWHDAHTEAPTWISLDEIDDEPYVVTTCGYLLPDAKPHHVCIAQSVGADGSVDAVLCVPVGMVVSVVVAD